MKKFIFKLISFLGAFSILNSSIKADMVSPNYPNPYDFTPQFIIGILVVCCLIVVSVILVALAGLYMIRKSKNTKSKK